MKQTQVKNFILALALVLTFSSTVLADDPYGNFAVGSGTENDPFLISTSDDLMMMSDVFRNNPTLGSVFPFYAAAYYELTDNIDMKGQYWSPISNTSTKVFLGDFNGAGYTISNLENPSLYCPGGSVGLFGYMGGKVYNLNLADIDLWSAPTGTSYGIGGVSGALHQRGVIENVNVTGKITVCDTAGRNGGGITGIVVGLDARISNSTFDGDIIGTISGVNALGGIVGYVNAYRLVVENCYSAGSITRPGAGGNLIGKIAGSPRDDTAFLNDTTSMTIDASTSSSAGWFGYDGIEVSADINTYSVLRSIESSRTEAKFDIMGYFPANNISILQIGLSFDGFDIDDCNIEFVPNPSFGRFDVIGDITSGSVTLTFGLFHGNAIAHDDEEFLVTVIVTPKDGKTPNEAKLTIDSIVGIDGGAWVYDFTAEFTTATSLFRLPCDINNDGEVDLLDYYWVMFYFGCPAAEWGTYYPDVTGEGVVDMLDVTYVIEAIYSN